jgi:hypothetical protein
METSFHDTVWCAVPIYPPRRKDDFSLSHTSHLYNASLAYHSHTPYVLATRLAGVVVARFHQVESPLSLSIFATRHHFANNHRLAEGHSIQVRSTRDITRSHRLSPLHWIRMEKPDVSLGSSRKWGTHR